MVKTPKASLLLTGLLAFLCLFFTLSTASAQITRTARGELFDINTRTAVGPYIYHTIDQDNHLTYQAIISRHEHNLRGTKQKHKILKLAPAPAGNWLVFSLTNSTQSSQWILDFGHSFQGRLAQVQELHVYNHSRDEYYKINQENKNSILLDGTALPLQITPGKTESFVIYLQAKSGMPVTIAPVILTQDLYMHSAKLSDLFGDLLKMLLIAFIGGFAVVSYISKQKLYMLFCLYYGLHLFILSVLPHLFISPIPMAGELTRLFLPLLVLINLVTTKYFLNIKIADHSENMEIFAAGFLLVACAVFSLIPIDPLSMWQNVAIFGSTLITMSIMIFITFIHGQKGQYIAYYYASAFLITLVGVFVSGMNIAGYFTPTALGVNFYWLLLPVQAGFFIVSSVRRFTFQQAEARDQEAREKRTAYSLARLQRSKESADQARLLRVIERERELMAELREREIQRTDEMRKAKETADEANAAKSAFLAVVSHEIRTPMTGIMGILRLLQDTQMNKEQKDYLHTLQTSGDTMLALLNDILDFEKIETGAMTLEEISVDIPKLAQDIITLMSGHVADKNIALKCEISERFPRSLIGDPTRLRQVLLNLVNNAIKFTEQGSVTIILRATKLENQPNAIHGDYEVYFAVKDTGVGISEDAQRTLFDPFQQADSSVARKYGGSGLGLAICQRLVSAMKSHIQIKSAEGKGSTFYFSLLMEEGHAITAEEKNAVQRTTTQATSITTKTTTPIHVMVVEDNDINRQVLQNFIENNGHSTVLCESGEKAIEYLIMPPADAKPVEVILTDINLTGISGLELARLVRDMDDPALAQLPIIAITGNVSQDDLQKINEAGISEALHKPVDYNKLIALLAGLSGKEKPTTSPLHNTPHPAPQDHVSDHISPVQAYAQSLQQEPTPAQNEEEASKPDSVALDHAMLKGLANSLGTAQTTELLQGCLDKAEEIIDLMSDENKHNDLSFLKDRAHELKGMAGNFGLSELADISSDAEKSAQNDNLPRTLEAIKKLPDCYRRADKALQNWLAENS